MSTISNKRDRPSLLQRARGPNAKPVELLVERGAAIAQRVNSGYKDFARACIAEMTKLAAEAPAQTALDRLTLAVKDLRSSSATCGNEAILRLARSLERILDPQFHHQRNFLPAIHLHLDALTLAAMQSEDWAELESLGERLETLVARFNPSAD